MLYATGIQCMQHIRATDFDFTFAAALAVSAAILVLTARTGGFKNFFHWNLWLSAGVAWACSTVNDSAPYLHHFLPHQVGKNTSIIWDWESQEWSVFCYNDSISYSQILLTCSNSFFNLFNQLFFFSDGLLERYLYKRQYCLFCSGKLQDFSTLFARTDEE